VYLPPAPPAPWAVALFPTSSSLKLALSSVLILPALCFPTHELGGSPLAGVSLEAGSEVDTSWREASERKFAGVAGGGESDVAAAALRV